MSVTALYLLHKKEFEPIVRPKDYVAILTPQAKWVYGRVVYVEPIHPQIKNLGSISAASATSYPTHRGTEELEEMEVGKNEFAQYRLLPLDDVMLEVYLPAAISRFNLKAGPTKISVRSPEHFAEIFVYEDNVPTIKYYAVLFRDLDNARIMFYGYRFVFEPLTTPPKEFTVIPATGVAPRST